MADKESPSSSAPSGASCVSAPTVDTKSANEKMAQPTHPIQDETPATSSTSAAAAASGAGNESSDKVSAAAPATEGSASPALDAVAATPGQNPAAMLLFPQDAAEGATSSDDAQQQQQEKGEVQQQVPKIPNGPTRGGILSPLAGLFGGNGKPGQKNDGNGAAEAAGAAQEEETADVESGDAGSQQQPSVSFDLGTVVKATETASDTVCSTTTDGDQQSGDEDSAAKASPPSSPSNRSATVLAKGSFAATEPCASFGDNDDDEDWIGDDPSFADSKKRKKKASDTTAKALPVGSCCRRYKRQMLYCLALLGMMVVFMGAGIAIGMKIVKPTSSSSSSAPSSTSAGNVSSAGDMEATQPQSKPEKKPADESVMEEDAKDVKEEMELEPIDRPADEPSLNDDSPASIPETDDESQPLEEPAIDSTEYSTPADSSTDTDDATLEVDETLDDAKVDTPTSITGEKTLFNVPATSAPSSNETDTNAAAIDEDIESDDGGDPNAYEPGNLQTLKYGVLLSKGLDCKIIAKTGKNVKFSGSATGAVSVDTFHARPDFGATFPTEDGGWVYVGNSEVANKKGGVGAIYFNKNAKVIDYKMLLKKTSMNCGGGRTPWDTWISCEEVARDGQIWEVDPLGVREAKMTVLGGNNTGGRFESFTYDVRDKEDPRFYYTEDRPDGPLRRFRPTSPDWSKPHKMLHGAGEIEYLVLDATASDNSKGTYNWTKNKTMAQATAANFFPGSEGIDADEGSGSLYFVSKKAKLIYVLDLDGNTWERRSTVSGVFDGSPDQLTRLVGEQEILYYTEEGGKDAGIHGRDAEGNFFSILESPVYSEETTGLAFSPDHKRMYVAYQANGIMLDVWRKDRLPFSSKSLNIKYHKTQV